MEISMIPDERGHSGQRCPAVYPTFGLGAGEGWRGWREVDFFKNKNIFFFLLRGWMAEWWWEIQEEREEKVREGPAGWRRRHRLMKSEHVAINSGRFSPYHLLF